MKATQALSLIALVQIALGADYKATVTHTEFLRNGTVRGSVLIVDERGLPLTDLNHIDLSIYEDGVLRQAKRISEGRRVSTALVLDLSGSMGGEKLRHAKEAAGHYVDQAPAGYEIAVVGFTSAPWRVSDFTTDRGKLHQSIRSLSAKPGQRTALSDAVASAISMLSTRIGRRAVLALTDGVDNQSKHTPDQVVKLAKASDVTVDIIGLGSNVDAGYLQRLAGNGRYLFAPSPQQLKTVFSQAGKVLAAEHQFEFVSPRPLDGSRRRIEARVEITAPGRESVVIQHPTRVVVPRFIPAVEGRLLPYGGMIALLLLVPAARKGWSSAASLRTLRHDCLKQVESGSKLIGISDGNGRVLRKDDPIVECRLCHHSHHVRSWRFNRCRCFNDNFQVFVCAHRVWPAWLRRQLDTLSGRKVTPTGRRWLCHCAGDEEGY